MIPLAKPQRVKDVPAKPSKMDVSHHFIQEIAVTEDRVQVRFTTRESSIPLDLSSSDWERDLQGVKIKPTSKRLLLMHMERHHLPQRAADNDAEVDRLVAARYAEKLAKGRNRGYAKWQKKQVEKL